MSWGTELWDQYDSIATHTSKGIDFLEKYGHFVDQRCKIELEYAAKLRRLVKNFIPKKKEKGEDDVQFSYMRAYKNLLNELGDQAGQHELVAENLSTQVVVELNSLVKNLKDDRRKHLAEGARIQAQLQSSLSLLSKTKEKYEKAFGASERALDAYQRADADLNLSRAEVEKQRMNSTLKSQQYDEAKNEYANQLQKTNESQYKFYHQALPAVFQNLQDLDEKRIKCIQNFFLKAIHSERDVLPIVNQCLDGMEKYTNEIDEKEDSRKVSEMYKTGFTPPEDFPFEDLSNAENISVNGSTHSIQGQIPGSAEKKTILGTITGGRVKKRSGFLGLFANNKTSQNNVQSEKEDFSDLPPNQRRKKLQQKIDDLNAKVCQQTAARDGLMKMKQVYETNPALGDPMSIQRQLTDNGHDLDKLRAELKKFQGFLDEMEGRLSNSPGNTLSTGGGPTPRSNGRRSSVSDGAESLSRSASDSSVSNPTVNHKNKAISTPLHGHGSSTTTTSSSSAAAGGSGGQEPIRKVTCKILNPATQEDKEQKEEANKQSSSNSPESGLGFSSTSLPSSDLHEPASKAGQAEPEEDEDEFFDPEPLPILGKCRALYPFEVTSEGSIRMEENEELWVIENDQGDGWTRVRRVNISPSDPMPEGFVPSTYIDIYELFIVPRPV